MGKNARGQHAKEKRETAAKGQKWKVNTCAGEPAMNNTIMAKTIMQKATLKGKYWHSWPWYSA